MLKIRLQKREQKILKDLEIRSTFKIPESSFIFMKIDVDGLSTRMKQHPDVVGKEEPKILKVQVPENKTSVLCLDTGKTQFIGSFEKVEVVEIDADEILGGKWKLLLMNFLAASGVKVDEILSEKATENTQAKAD